MQPQNREVVTQLKDINSGVSQGSVLGPVLYLLYTADLPVAPGIITATYADDTVILTAHKDHVEASQPQKSLFHIQIWLKKWKIKVNGAKSVQMTFTTRRKTCPPVILNGMSIPQAENARYLRLHLDRRLTNWKKHISTKRKQLGIQLRCTGCSVASRSCQSKVNCCCTKQSLNQYGLTVSNFGAQLPIQT